MGGNFTVYHCSGVKLNYNHALIRQEKCHCICTPTETGFCMTINKSTWLFVSQLHWEGKSLIGVEHKSDLTKYHQWINEKQTINLILQNMIDGLMRNKRRIGTLKNQYLKQKHCKGTKLF